MKTSTQTNLPEDKSFVTKKITAKTNAMIIGNRHTDQVLEGFTRESRVTGLTNGKFSLISLIQSALKITGPANVIIATWAAGFYDSTEIHNLLTSHMITDFKIILDRSFKTRQVDYSEHLTEIFKTNNIRTTNTHSKFVLLYNADWNISIRTSMNLNENKRCENFDIDNDIDVFNVFKHFSDELFSKQPEGIIESRGVVDPVFDEIFMSENEKTMHENDNNIPSPEEQVAQVGGFIAIINQIYRPAQSIDTATHFFSTEEIYNSLKDINPGSQISKESVYTAMTNAGYVFRPRKGSMGIDMKWLLQSL